jgi:NAD(P)-dependent dehydrogenase (short-subunit alcohol dehydrogenase family)
MRRAGRRVSAFNQGSSVPGSTLLFRGAVVAGTLMAMTSPTKIALITGANRGLGRATALALAAEGVDIVLTYRSNEEEAADVVASVEALGRVAVALRLDTTEIGTFEAFAASVRSALESSFDGRSSIDFLVNNAGSAAQAPFAETTEDQFDLMFGVHVKGPFFLTQTLLGLLADGGAVVNFSTGLARFTNAGMSAYAAAKGAIEVLTRYQALELGSRGIRVNTIAPGPIGTDFGGGYLRDNDELRSTLSASCALGRVGEPDDVGAAVAGLLVHSGGWVNGQRIEVSGGTRL